MAEPRFSNIAAAGSDDDLPRTLRREREAQARRAREHEFPDTPGASSAAFVPDVTAPQFEAQNYDYDDAAPATVTRLEIPFIHLMFFFLKAVVAGIPALILLLAILWGVGEVVKTVFPELIQMQVLIRMPQ